MKKKWESQEFVDRVLWAVSGDGAKELRERNSRRLRELWRDDQYRKEMSDRKREDWKDLTYRENILGKIIIKTWERLKSGKKTYIEIAVEQELIRLGFAPEYNHRVGNRFIDLALLDYMIGVECDGEFWHRGMEERDAKRDAYLLKHGWTIVRLTEKEIQHDVANAVSQKVLPLLSR